MSDEYRFYGNISAVEPCYAIGLWCDVCKIKWVGCWDNAACPQCGNHEAWNKLMEDNGYYGKSLKPSQLSRPNPEESPI